MLQKTNMPLKMMALLCACFILLLAASGCGSNAGGGSGADDTAAAGASQAPTADGAAPAASAQGGEDGTQAATPEATALEPVELTWYYPEAKSQPDLQLVNDELNKLTQAKINATIKLQPIDFDNYPIKMNTMVAANESFDILWTGSWLFEWVQNQKKGVFRPLDDLLEGYGQKLYASMPEKFWNDAKLDGNIWGVPSYQIAARRPSLVIQKRFADKYNLDTDSIKTLADIEPFLKQVKEGEPGVVAYGTTGGFDTLLFGMDPFAEVRRGDPEHKIVMGTTPEFEQYLHMMHSWYTSGYINKDAATVKDITTIIAKGNVAVWYDYTGKPGSEGDFKLQDGGNDVVLVPLMEPYFTGSSSTMNAISRTSKNPERAMMFLELVNTDKQVYNLLNYGIEGKHYTKLSDNVVRPVPDSGYAPNTDWVFGNITNEYLPEGVAADKFERTKEVNDAAVVSPYYGYVFNTEPVKTELANEEAVDGEFLQGLTSGAIDPDVYLPKYEDKQAKAGMDRIIAEKQKQLDAWVQNHGDR